MKTDSCSKIPSVFLSPNQIIFGNDSSTLIGEHVKALSGERVLIVTDPDVVKIGLLEKVKTSLKLGGIKVYIYDKVEPEPSAHLVGEGADIIKEKNIDIIVGIGGGSSLDVAKGMSIMAANDGNILDYAGTDLVLKKGLPKILIPTTAGSGSEVTRVLVLTDKSTNIKKVVYSNYNLADIALIDPTLTLTLPQKVTADTGIDALVHAIEAYVSVNANFLSDILAIQAINLISNNLPITYSKGSNMEARYNMSLAATIAGLAFTSAGLGAVHALAYVLGTEYNMSHGRSNAIMLPHVMDYNKLGNLAKFSNIAQAMGEPIQNISVGDAAGRSVVIVKNLIESIGISTSLSSYGISEKDLPILVKGGMEQARLFGINPRDLNAENVKDIYTRAI